MQSPTSPSIQRFLSECASGHRVQVIFGSPRHDCDRMGVCRIEPDVWDQSEGIFAHCGCPRASAFAAKDEYGRLQLHFLKSSLGQSVQDRYFPGGSFVVEDPYPLPGWFRHQLHLETAGTLSVQPAHYPILDLGPYLTASVGLYMEAKQLVIPALAA